MTDVPMATDPEGPSKRVPRRMRNLSLGVVALGVGAAGVFAWTQVKPVVESRKYASVTYEVPAAPKLTPAAGETLLRIDPTKSSLTYEVDEELAGQKTGTATGVTNAIAGDLAVNTGALEKSRVGPIVANIEQFTSNNNLRDARIRQDFLKSHKFPLATVAIEDINGLSGKLEEGHTYTFTMDGFVTVKETPATATFDVTATMSGGRLTATATTMAKLSRFDAGPISIAGLVRTKDDVRLTLKFTALDPATNTIPTTITGPDQVDTNSGDVPSYERTIAPILEKHCASCHNSGQFGAHTLTLDTAADVRAVSDGIATVTQAGYMPPWPASDKGVALAHKPTLSKADMTVLAAWSNAGGPLDVAPTTKLVPTKEAAALLPRRDVSLRRAKPYTAKSTNPNDYRCFVLDPKVTKPEYLTGYTFLADQVEVLHHAQVFHISAEQLENSKSKDGADGDPGWSCYGGPELRGRRPDRDPGKTRTRDVGFAGQANLVAGWVPGQSPVIFPQNSGILIEPGDALVLQIHYHYAGTPIADNSGLALQLDPGSSDVRELRVVNPLAPVEIPCAPKDKDQPLCDREAAIADNVKLYGPSGASNESGLLMLCGQTPESLTKGFDGRIARSSCNLKVPEDGTIIGAMGHMHTLGKTFRLTLDPGTAEEKILLDIPDWSFDWQMNYGLETPLKVKAGQPLLLECSWDRAADPLRAPKYIVFAEGTEDEMCFGTYSLIPDHQQR